MRLRLAEFIAVNHSPVWRVVRLLDRTRRLLSRAHPKMQRRVAAE